MKKIVAVIGSNGAIGNSISENLLKDDMVDCIYKFSRKINAKDTDKVKNFVVDIEDEDSIKEAVQSLPDNI